MHIIQKRILKKLSERSCLRYSDMRPPNIESNQFSYHLKSLIRQGYVRRGSTDYCLTTKGLEFCTRVNFEYFFVRAQPKIVSLIVCRNKKGEYLLYRRSKQPFLGMIGFPYGKIHMGESVQTAAERELQEKTNLRARLKQKGIMYLTVLDADGEIIVHMLCHIFNASDPQGEAHSGPYGKVFWAGKKELISSTLMPGVLRVLELSERKTSGIQFEEHTFQLAKGEPDA